MIPAAFELATEQIALPNETSVSVNNHTYGFPEVKLEKTKKQKSAENNGSYLVLDNHKIRGFKLLNLSTAFKSSFLFIL